MKCCDTKKKCDIPKPPGMAKPKPEFVVPDKSSTSKKQPPPWKKKF